MDVRGREADIPDMRGEVALGTDDKTMTLTQKPELERLLEESLGDSRPHCNKAFQSHVWFWIYLRILMVGCLSKRRKMCILCLCGKGGGFVDPVWRPAANAV